MERQSINAHSHRQQTCVDNSCAKEPTHHEDLTHPLTYPTANSTARVSTSGGLGATLAKGLGCPFIDADDLYLQTNIDHVQRRTADQRELRAMAHERAQNSYRMVRQPKVACSALEEKNGRCPVGNLQSSIRLFIWWTTPAAAHT